ncbi:MAG: ABC transporter ATP-binding protein [Bacteroidaceae bacterium]|nr:ABC transporter ATP-binding protein [Bacteroidaceae bacterium]
MIRRLLNWLWLASTGIRGKLVLNALCGLLYIAASLSFVYFSKGAIDLVTRGVVTSRSTIYLYGVILLLLFLTEMLLNLLMSWLENQTEVTQKNYLRHRLYSHLMHVDWEHWERFHSGDVLNRLEEDVRVVAETVCKSVPQLFTTSVQILAAFIFLYYMSPILAWSVIFIMPFFLLVSKLYFRKMRKLTKDIRSTDSAVQSVMQESLQHHMLIQSMEQHDAFVDRLNTLQTSLYGQTMHRTRFNLFSRAMVTLGFILGYMTAFMWGIIGLQDGLITFGTMTAFLQLVNRIQRPTVDLTRLIPDFVHASASIDRIEELEALPGEPVGESKLLQGVAGISIGHLTFRYQTGERDIYNDFSHDFKPGSRTAIVGETGSGKSTLIKLILSLLQPTAGEIFLYNKAERVPMAPELRGNLVYVPQGNSLLSGTIRSNLLLGNADATEEQMWEALHTAAADFVSDLPLKLDAHCGEWGDGLSEGQAQRIAVARGLLRPGSILLLDEFSASLDKETERMLIEKLMRSATDKTMIFITHREMILNYCDEVIRL